MKMEQFFLGVKIITRHEKAKIVKKNIFHDEQALRKRDVNLRNSEIFAAFSRCCNIIFSCYLYAFVDLCCQYFTKYRTFWKVLVLEIICHKCRISIDVQKFFSYFCVCLGLLPQNNDVKLVAIYRSKIQEMLLTSLFRSLACYGHSP